MDDPAAPLPSLDETDSVGLRPAVAVGRSSVDEGNRLRKNLLAIMSDGAAFSVMVGVGETYLPAFVLALGMSQVAAGLTASVPMLAGAVLQLVSPRAVRLLGSHRRWVVLCAAVQAGSFLPLVAAALAGSIPLAGVLVVATVYWGAGLGTGPAWNTWVSGLVPPPIRVNFFARRTRVSQAAVLAGLLCGGLALHLGQSAGRPLTAFGVLFFVAGVCRLLSAGFLFSQSESRPVAANHRIVPLGEWLSRLRHGPERLLLYLLAVQTSVQLMGPYLTPYMLGKLEFSYADYMILIGTSFVAKILVLPTMGRFARRFGARTLLWLGGLGVAPLPVFWLMSDSFGVLLVAQAAGGMAWAAHELGMFLGFFETIAEEERTSVLTTFNFANAAALVCGSVLGGVLLRAMGTTLAAYAVLFALSFAARSASLLMLGHLPEFMRTPVPLALRTLAVRPSAGSIDRPILASVQTEPVRVGRQES
jgi:MFS family permease